MFVKKIFQKVASNNGFNDFPNIGSIPSYGVFGRFGPKQGNIYSDDQNDGHILCHKNNYNHWSVGNDLTDCVLIEDAATGKNTRFYFSYVKNIECYLQP